MLWSIDIDISVLEQNIQEDENNVPARIVLARNYVSNGNYSGARKLLNDVLKLRKNHVKASQLLKDIDKLQQISSLVKSDALSKSSKVTSYFKKLLVKKDHKSIDSIYQTLKRNNIELQKEAYRPIIQSYIDTKKYDKAYLITNNSSMASKDIYFFKGQIKELQKDMDSAEEFYKKSINYSEEKEVVLKLHDLYITTNQPKKAKLLVNTYFAKYKSNPTYKALQEQDEKLLLKRSDELKSIYKNSRLFKDFKEYYYELEGLGYKKKAFSGLEEFVKDNPSDEDARLFLAKKYYWSKRVQESFDLLKPVAKNSKNSGIKKLYVDLKSQLQKPKQAQAKYQKPSQELIIDGIKHKAETYYFKNDYTNAVVYYEDYFNQTSKDSATRFHYADALSNLKKYPQSEEQYRLVARQKDKLFTLSLFRYAKTLMVQKDDRKWNKARVVVQALKKILAKQQPSKQRDDLILHTDRTWEIVKKPMLKPTKHKDVMLTEIQRKILDGNTLVGGRIISKNINSIKSIINPFGQNLDKKIRTTIFGSTLDDESMKNISYGLRIGNIIYTKQSSVSLEVKQSKFESKGSNSRISRSVSYSENNSNINSTNRVARTIDATSLTAYYDTKDLSISAGVHSFDDMKFSVGLELRSFVGSHDITYGIGYKPGVFIYGMPCMIDDDINVISLSLYDSILLNNLEQAEFTLQINSFTDSNLNINNFIDYPIYKVESGNFKNVFLLSGSYEYNSKDDTCYKSVDFFDGNYLQMRSRYKFGKDSFIEGIGSVGYSFKSSDSLYSYGLKLQVIADDSFDVSIDCRHYQSGYSPDGADECFASVTHVW
jgi:thioredoxin-like negative regulator of GroEL